MKENAIKGVKFDVFQHQTDPKLRYSVYFHRREHQHNKQQTTYLHLRSWNPKIFIISV